MTEGLPAELAKLPLLAGATGEELAALAATVVVGEAPAGTVLGREGDPGDSFWLLLDGRAEITIQRHDGTGPRHLAFVGAGSILGELGLLRHQARSATITAVEPLRFATGGHEALDQLLTIEAVRVRLRLLASTRLAEDVRPVHADLPDGTPILVRPLLAEDREALGDGLRALSAESLRRRFFSGSRPSDALIDYLTHIDYVDHFAWAVLDAGGNFGLATARYVRINQTDTAEAAFTTSDAYQGRGIGTFLLGCLGATALQAGIARLVSYVLEDNLAMRAVLAKAAGKAAFDEPGVLAVTVASEAAAGLLSPATREALGTAVHDVVTAASLALARPTSA